MTKIMKRAIIITIFATLVTTLTAIFGLFLPMHAELEQSLIGNFIQLTESKHQSISNVVNRSVEGAQSLSSRTMIQRAIGDYLEGEITFAELQEYTQSKYEDGAKVLDYLLYAQRVVEGKTAAQFGSPPTEENAPLSVSQDFNVYQQFKYQNGRLIFEVVSPIHSNGQLLGHDRLLYDMEAQTKLLCGGCYKVYILTDEGFGELLGGHEPVSETDSVTYYWSKPNVYGVVQIQENAALVVESDDGVVYSAVNRLAWQVSITWLVVFVVILAAIYLYVLRFARKLLHQTEVSRDQFKGMAYRDKMTGAYSRMFLEVWNTTLRSKEKPCAVVMLDIDRFKSVNDQHGHLTGDQVIKEVSDALVAGIRDGDYLIRFGGDEFLLLLEGHDEDSARSIVFRVAQKVRQIDAFSFDISVSYGISTLAPGDDLNEKLGIADARMYESKKQKDS